MADNVNGVHERPKFTELNNLCTEATGAEILFATDDWFAAAENLIQDSDPVWKEGVFDDCGKWMDGWETRRKRIPGHDWCLIKLSYPGIIHGVDLDTAFFTGNYAPRISLQGANLENHEEKLIPKRRKGRANGIGATKEQLIEVSKLQSENWEVLVPKKNLLPGYSNTRHNYVPIESRKTWTHLRLNYFPDGGVARLRVYGQVSIATPKPNKSGQVDLVAVENGGLCIGYSDAHYGHPRNLILPGEAGNMGEGWETARRLDRPEILVAEANGVLKIPGNEWAAFRLGVPGLINKIIIDTMHFKGNFPDSITIWSANQEVKGEDTKGWDLLLQPQKLAAHQIHVFEKELKLTTRVNYIKIAIAPDGGLARVRIFGFPTV